MWPHALAALRLATRSPAPWGWLCGGVAVAWFGLACAVLALHSDPLRSALLVASTAGLTGLVVGLWTLSSVFDGSATGGLSLAADATRSGQGGRLVGGWLGAVGAGGGAILLLAAPLTLTGHVLAEYIYYLLLASILQVALGVAWAMPLVARGRPLAGALLAGALYFAGHSPWGRGGFGEGTFARIARGLLPPAPNVGATWSELTAPLATTAGLLLLSLALLAATRRPDATI